MNAHLRKRRERASFIHPIMLAIIAMVFASCSGGSSETSQTYYVSSNAVPAGDGMSWKTAFTHPQDALDIAQSGDQIWVAEGEYGLRENTDRHVLSLKRGVRIFGGFYGDEDDVEMRDPEAAITILDGQGYAYHVVLAIGVQGAVLEGFTVTGGMAVGCGMESTVGGQSDGGGVFNAYSSLEIRQCRFIENTASHKGGAIYSEESETVLMECNFERNCSAFGGGINNHKSVSTIVNSVFTDNRAEFSGGAVSNFTSSSTTFVNTVFSGNSSYGTAGAVLSNSSDTAITNCTFNGNRCQLGPGGAFSLYEGTALIINSILWGDLSQDYSEILTQNGDVVVRYSIVKGGSDGTGNLDQKPDFIEEGVWDEAGNWINGDYRLLQGSPGIDSGTSEGAPNFDLSGNLRPQELAHDRGAYEYSGE